ncbi:hypothetical protein ACPUEK_14995 [Marinomonas gallaica]|uniref:hypothetical protein n=1 Tax=Marinomonas gallaica TaxID=1806667 RepID=UPI00082BCD9F|nr:hypothetical protein [Marinomonas gallaica]
MRSNKVKSQNQKVMVGGYCGIIAGLCFLFGMLVYVCFLMEYRFGDINEPFASQVRTMAEHALLLYGWYFIIYIVFGLALLGFQIGIQPYLKVGGLQQACAVLGYLWVGLTLTTGMLANVGNTMILQVVSFDSSSAMYLWYALQMLIDGLGGGHEIVGGVWMLTLGAALISFNIYGLGLKVLAFIIGSIGVLSSAPGLSMLGGAFGLGCIVWFLIIGALMIKHTSKRYA